MKHEFQSYYLDSPLICGRVFDLFLPETATQDTALFFVHGGGWNAGSRTGFHQIMEKYNELGYICASTDYRLPGPVRFSDSPGVTAFDQLQDIRESYDRFVSLLKTMGRPLKIAVFGTSAGAHLASLLLCAAPGECGEHCELRNEWVKPSCGFLQSTPVVFEPWQDIFPHIWHAMQFFAAGCMYETDPKRFQALSLRSDDFGGEATPYPLFWLKYDDISTYLARHTMMASNYNNVTNMTAADYFAMNMYEGKIYKTNNMQGTVLANYCKTDSAMANEQKRIEKQLVTKKMLL